MIPVKNSSMRDVSDQGLSSRGEVAAGSTSGLVFIAITLCRVMDTRGQAKQKLPKLATCGLSPIGRLPCGWEL